MESETATAGCVTTSDARAAGFLPGGDQLEVADGAGGRVARQHPDRRRRAASKSSRVNRVDRAV